MKKYYLLILISALLTTQVYAQARKVNKRNPTGTAAAKKSNPFLQKQFWLGFKAGTNLTQAKVQESYSVIVPPPNAIVDVKNYKNFNLTGSQVALEVTFYTKGFSISVQPTYFHSRFEYANRYEWMDANSPTNLLTLNYKQEQQTDYAELPLLVKYDIAGSVLRPFVQAGVYYAIQVNANKAVTVNGVDYASGGLNEFENDPILVGAEDLFAKNYWGISAGAGVNYNLGNVRLTLEGNYRMGMSLANSTENRYKNDRLAGVGDALDDIKLNNIVFSFGCLFPMRYLASGFKTLDR
ncbi:PorT family protein [Chryseotalea sanaruensis]|uniref:PorT family protein n=1 Tax=Chryseotalea sanaruensis TaxID=2482724 RepID=A0A401U6X4_9BACT|nr:outer membrane beta-barrel protein [Chryseotalea sanaruensis]GCC50546.1 PorT family protein [Chryseotalea sanaruensis]